MHDKYFPKVRLSRKKANDKIWITEGIKKSIKHKHKLFQLQLNNPSEENVKTWKIYRNQLNKIINKAQIEYYKNLIDMQSTSCQGLWKTFGSIISQNKTKQSQIKQLKVDNKTIKNPSDIPAIFNNFFCNIGSKLSSKFHSTPDNAFSKYMGQRANQSMFLFETDAEEVAKIINNLENKKSTGHDDITVKFIKISSTYISELLARVINISIKTGIYPDQLKIAKILPLYKKGSNSDPSNYRPISILSIINKIFEKILHKRLYNYLNKFNILYKYQFGFRKGHSTTQALIELTDNIKRGLDNKQYTCGIFIDLCKAFDTVDHNILLNKMHHYGIRGVVYKLFKSYLTNRMQYTSVNNYTSKLQHLNCGVPQGSVLGPLLFLLYINDIAKCCNAGLFRVFADDTGIFCQGNDIDALIDIARDIMTKIEEWFSCNKLTLNVDKTCFIIFKSTRWRNVNIPDRINFNNKSINRVSCIKYLGLYLDELLNWNNHVNEVCNALKRFFPTFYNIRSYLNLKLARTIYYAMMYSKIKYAISVYGLTSLENINKIQVLQNKLLKVVTFKNYRYSTNQLHNDFDILKIDDIIDQEILVFVHGYINDKLPSVFDNYFSHRFPIEDYINSERKIRFIIPRHNSNMGADAINVKGAQLWNNLKIDIKPTVSNKVFKKAFKDSILIYKP